MRTLFLLCLLLAGGVGYGQDCQTINTSFDFCDGIFFDDGSGPELNYENNLSLCWLLDSDPGFLPTLSFSFISIEEGFDFIQVFDGPDENAPLLANFTGDIDTDELFVGSSGQLFLKFTSDVSVTAAGFEALYSCIPGGSNCTANFTLNCGQTDNWNNFNSGNDLTIADYSCYTSPVGSQYNGNDYVYTVQHAGGSFSVTLFNENGVDLDLFLKEDCGTTGPTAAQNSSTLNCITSSTNDVLVGGVNLDNIYLDFLEAGTYYVVVDGVSPADVTDYRITYNCNFDYICGWEDELQCGVTYEHDNFSNLGERPNRTSNYCGQTQLQPGAGCTGPEHIYFVDVTVPGTYTFTLNPISTGADFEIFLLNSTVLFGEVVQLCGDNNNCVVTPDLNPVNQGETIQVFLEVGEYYFIVDGFNGTEGEYTLRMDCPSVCDDPTFTQCGNQTILPVNNTEYLIEANDQNFDFENPWYINDGPADDVPGVSTDQAGNQLFCDFSTPGSYEICYPYVDADGCVNYCCRTYCIDFVPEGTIEYAFNGDDGFTLSLAGVGGASDVQWFEEDGSVDALGGGLVVDYSIPVGPCRTRTFFVRYFDPVFNCYRTIRRQIFICDPFACGDITYTYTYNDGYQLTLTGVTNAQDILWQDDQTGETLGTGLTAFPPINGFCGYRDYSVRYRIGEVWYICCIRVYICDPFDCGLITPSYLAGDNGYELTYDGPDSDNYTWTDDDTGQTIPGSGNTIFLPYDGNCRTRSISVRFYDPVLNRWRICCLVFDFCPCPTPTFDFNCGTQAHVQIGADGGNDFQFMTNDDSYPNQGDWIINENSYTELSYATLLSNGVLDLDFPTPGTYNICYVTIGEDGCENYCCRTYCIDFTPPVVPTNFEVASNQTGYTLSFSEAGATNVSWYADGTSLSGNGASVFIPFPVEGCFYRTYYFRYRDAGGCWKTAYRRVYICNPFNCADIIYDYDRLNGEWELSFQGDASTSSITWIDDDNNGNELASGTADLSIDPRPGGSCGYRNISIRYFDGVGWRYCCLRFWDCDPYDCGSFTTFNNEAAETVQLTFTGANATQITWQDDVTGQALPNSAGQTVVPLPWPVEGCVTRYVSVRYFDVVLGIFRVCCIEVEVCRPVPCDPPLFNICNDQIYYQQADGGFRIRTNNPGFTTESEWFIGNSPASQADFQVVQQGNEITCYFPGPGSYRVCYPYYDAFGCLQYCCQEYCIAEDPPATLTDFTVDQTGGAYELSLSVAGASSVQWYYLEGNAEVTFPSGPDVILPFPGECYTRTFYCRYRDAAGCWRVVSRRVVICDPAACGNIRYQFNAATNAFVLTLEDGNASQITWIDDDNDLELGFNQPTISVALEAVCGPRNISVRYFDGTRWRICCLRYDACNPFACNLIIPEYDAQNNRYVLTLAEADGLQELSWADDDDPSVNFAETGATLVVPVAGPCRQRNISVRYFDPISGLWGVCCVSYWQCFPDACGAVIVDQELGENTMGLSVAADFTDVSWEVGGANAGAGNSIEAVIAEGQTLRVCVRYFDPVARYWRVCCREVTNPDCDLPAPTFTTHLVTLDSVLLTNTNVRPEETYAWAVDGSPLPNPASPQILHLPPGQYEICLTATNTCGPRTVCRTIIVPNPAVDLIFDIDEAICGQPGEVIDVPLRVRNFTEVDAFQFTVQLSRTDLGKLITANYQLATGIFNVASINDSTLAIIWTQSGPNGRTLADGTILANLRVELAALAPVGTTLVAYANQPTEPFYGLVNGQAGVPALIAGEFGVCPADAELSGMIRNASGAGVGLVDVTLSQNGVELQTVTTDLSGTYAFTGLTQGVSYTITPEKDINPRNGVNAGDMSSVRRHIFGQAPLTTPYQRIAANVINFAGIEATDVSQLRQLIFQQIPRFSQVNSWHFVPAAYPFPDPDNPLTPAYPMTLDVTPNSGPNDNLDFIAVKMGDINDGALPGQLMSNTGTPNRSASDLKFSAVSDAPRRDGTYRVDILVEDFTEMVAAQFSLNWNPEVLRFDSLAALNADLALSELNFSFDRTASGQLPWLWFGEGRGTIPDSSLVFSLYFTVVGEGGTIAELNFTEDPTVFYFEDTEGEVLARFTEIAEEVLFPVSANEPLNRYRLKIMPNPAASVFHLEGVDGQPLESVRLLDMRGRQVKAWEGRVPTEGFDVADLATGVYLIELRTAGGYQVERLVVSR